MARVPTVDGPNVAPAALQAPMQRTAATPGLLANQQLGEAGRVLTEATAQIQDRTDADLVMRAETELKNQYAEWEAGAKQRRGQQAWGVAKDASKWFDDTAGKLGGELQTERQRALFNQTAQKLRTQSLSIFSAHEADQRRASLDQSAQASIVGSINLAAANPDNPQVLLAAKGDIVKRSAMLAQLNGWSPEFKAAKEGEYLTSLHRQVLQGLVDRDPKAAEAYFAANKAEIDGSQHAEIGKVLKVGVQLRAAQTFADEVMSSGMDELGALAEARKRFEGEDEKLAVAEVKGRFAERTAARERAQRDAADQAWGIYARSGRLSAVPPSVLASMDGQQLAALRRTAQQDAEGKAPQTDMSAYYALSRLADGDPEAFQRRDLRQDFPSLSAADRKHFIDLQARIKDPSEKVKEESFTRQFTVAFRTLGWGGEKDAPKMGAYEKAVRDEVRAQESVQRRPLKDTERQAIMDRLLIEGDINGMWPGGGRRLFEVVGTPDAEKFRAKVPDAERSKIEAALKRAGQPVTEEAVRRLYLQRNGL